MARTPPIAGRYEVLETVSSEPGREEMRARDLVLGREVTLLRSRVTPADEPGLPRALREARALAALDHRGIQHLHDVLEEAEGPILVLEPLAGERLSARLTREGRLSIPQVLRLGIELSEALAVVHAAGCVHRDVSADHVVLRPDGSACLGGFGLAKPITFLGGTSIQYAGASATGDGEPGPGLPAHPAPEQLAGETASPRSDLFALGCVLYRALTGRDAEPDMLEHGWSAPTDPRRTVRETPTALSQIVLACLARSPVGRPRSAAEVADALRAAEVPAGRIRFRRSSWIGAGAAATVLLAAFAARDRIRSTPDLPRGIAQASGGPGRGTDEYGRGFHGSRALLIGIGERYRRGGFPPLANSVGDVEAIAAALEALPGWKTTVLVEDAATFDGIRAALVAFEEGLDREDRALVYFAGHGVPHEHSGTSGWLIPADGESLERDPSRRRWLHFDAFSRFLRDAPAKHVLLAMDCCYGGHLTTTRSAGAQAYEERFTTRLAHVVLAAGRADEPVSDGGDRGHSPFAEVFLEALDGSEGAFTSSQLHARMLDVFTTRGLPQTPVLAFPEDSPPGEFVFTRE